MPRVLVVGAGLAGLSCAYHLLTRGLEVTVVEARSRVGGRVVTIRDWHGDSIAEGGAEFIDSHHRHVLRWAAFFGLETLSLDQWPNLPRTPGEERFWSSVRELSRLLPSSRRFFPLPEELAPFDEMSVSQWCRELKLDEPSQKAVETWCRGVELVEPEEVSMLGLIMEERQRGALSLRASLTLREGMDQLPHQLALGIEKLGGRIVLDSPVSKVQWTADSVEIQSGSETFVGFRAVLTMPPRVMGEVQFLPALPQNKRRAHSELGFGKITKTLMEFDRRFWDSGKSGRLLSIYDDEINAVWECSRNDDDAVLVVWVTGANSERLGELDEAERIDWALERLEARLPGATHHFVKGRSLHWTGDSHCRGGYSHFQVGFLARRGEHLTTPLGPLHFGGEHTSPFSGYMEGALESGARCALEILKKR